MPTPHPTLSQTRQPRFHYHPSPPTNRRILPHRPPAASRRPSNTKPRFSKHPSSSALASGHSFAITFDANGNTTTDDLGRTLVYDPWNRLIAVSNSGTTLKLYTYDGMGRRTTEIVPGTPVNNLYYSASWQVLQSGASYFVWSPVYVDALVCRDLGFQNGPFALQRVYCLQDAGCNSTAMVQVQLNLPDITGDGNDDIQDLNTVTSHWHNTVGNGPASGDFNSDGYVDDADLNAVLANWQQHGIALPTQWTVSQRLVYTVHGEFAAFDGDFNTGVNFLGWQSTFKGGIQDALTGNINFDYRDYNPRTCTWNTSDPIQAGMNWYEAFGGNPINKVDPKGESAEDVWEKWSTGHLKKAIAVDITGSAVAGTGAVGALQIVFFPDTDEIGFFAISNAALGAPHPTSVLKTALLDMPIGYDISISVNGSVAIYRGAGAADPASFSGVFYGVNGGGGPLGKVGLGAFWDPKFPNGWIGASVGVGIAAPGISLKTNPEMFWLVGSIHLPKCISYALIAAM